MSQLTNQIFDPSLHALGFEFHEISPEKVSGHLVVTLKCCQALKMLHGGVTATIAEGLASIGAFMAAGRQRIAGIQLTINHIRAAQLGETVYAEAVPVNVGKTIQVWDAQIWKSDPKNSKLKIMVSSARLTLATNLTLPDYATDAAKDLLKASSKL